MDLFLNKANQNIYIKTINLKSHGKTALLF